MGNKIESECVDDASISEFKSDFQSLPSDIVISKWIFENVPYIFQGNRQHYFEVKSYLSEQLSVDSCSIIFVGSCSVGFSLNPNKNFKKYDENSDIDIAIISHYYFDVAWRTIRDVDYSNQTLNVQNAIKDHRTRLIYWGTIATDKILGLLPFGGKWLSTIESLKSDPIFLNRKISFRLYQDHEALRLYHKNNLTRNLQISLGVEPSITKL